MRLSSINFKPKHLLMAGAMAAISSVPIKLSMRPKLEVKDRFVKEATVDKPIKNIVVADNFAYRNIDIDYDLLSDISHGELVSTILEEGLPNANIIKHNVFPTEGEEKDSVINNLDKLFTSMLKDLKNGKKYEAINLSLGFSVPYSTIFFEVGEKIDPENAPFYTKDIKYCLREKLDKGFQIVSQPMKKIVEVIDKMDTLSSKGVKIYIAAGNTSDTRFDFFSLVDGSIYVGALDENGATAEYSNTSAINRWEYGQVNSKVTDDGYDVTGDGKTDIPKKRTTSWLSIQTPYMNNKGTSFATPRAIVKDFAQPEVN